MRRVETDNVQQGRNQSVGQQGFGRVVLCAVVVLQIMRVSSAAQNTVQRLPEQVLWRSVKTMIIPSDTTDMKEHLEVGVAVSELVISPNGSVASVSILDAPGPRVRRSLAAALLQWRFDDITAERGKVLRQGKITLYFLQKDGTVTGVPAPKAPYVGRWPRNGAEGAQRTFLFTPAYRPAGKDAARSYRIVPRVVFGAVRAAVAAFFMAT